MNTLTPNIINTRYTIFMRTHYILQTIQNKSISNYLRTLRKSLKMPATAAIKLYLLKIYKIQPDVSKHCLYLTASTFALFCFCFNYFSFFYTFLWSFKSTITNIHLYIWVFYTHMYKILTQTQEFYGYWLRDIIDKTLTVTLCPGVSFCLRLPYFMWLRSRARSFEVWKIPWKF